MERKLSSHSRENDNIMDVKLGKSHNEKFCPNPAIYEALHEGDKTQNKCLQETCYFHFYFNVNKHVLNVSGNGR